VTFIYLVSAGPVEEDITESVETDLGRAFGFATRRIDPLEEPAYAYDPRRRQYASSLILGRLMGMIPRDAIRLLALTEKDLFIPVLSFIFGQAQLQGQVAIVSLARLRQEFYGLAPVKSLLRARAGKEAIHEVGHTLGLVHCPDRTCAMSLSTNIRQVDIKRMEFCSSCDILVRESAKMIQKKTAGSDCAEGKR